MAETKIGFPDYFSPTSKVNLQTKPLHSIPFKRDRYIEGILKELISEERSLIIDVSQLRK